MPRTSDPLDHRGRISQGWTRMFWMALDDDPPGRRWYRKWHRKWGMRPADVKRVHEALFGQSGRGCNDKVGKVDTVRLLLASVGIPFIAARQEDKQDEQRRCKGLISRLFQI